QSAESQGASRQERRQLDGQALRKKAVGRREQLLGLLRLSAGGQKARDTEIDAAYGRIATPDQLAQSLAALAKLGRGFLSAKAAAALRKRAVMAGLDAAYLDETEALAKQARTELRTATATRETGPVTQSEVDLWDGVNLYLLGRIIDLFEIAHH